MADANPTPDKGKATLARSKMNSKSDKKTPTVQQKNEIRECFEMLDDGDGLMRPEEFFKSMYALGLVPKEGESDELFAKTDTDGSGEIDIDEFTALMSNHIMEKENKEYAVLTKLLRKIELEDKRSPLEHLQATSKKMGSEVIDDEELKGLLAKGVDGEGALMPGFQLDTFFDSLFSSTEPMALRTWYPGKRNEERLEEAKAEEKRKAHAEREATIERENPMKAKSNKGFKT